MNLPLGTTVYVGNVRYRGEIPDALLDRLPDGLIPPPKTIRSRSTGSTKKSPEKSRVDNSG